MDTALTMIGGLTAGAALGGLALARRAPRVASRDTGYVAVAGGVVVRASLARKAAPAGSLEALRHQVGERWLRRDAASYVLAPFDSEQRTTRVTLTSNNPLQALDHDSEWELDLVAPAPLPAAAYRRPASQLSALAAAAMVASYVADLLQTSQPVHLPTASADQLRGLPPHARTLQPAVRGRWYLASLATPSGHAFRAVLGSGAGITITSTPAGAVSVSPHTNTFTAHTNSDTRPVPGAY